MAGKLNLNLSIGLQIFLTGFLEKFAFRTRNFKSNLISMHFKILWQILKNADDHIREIFSDDFSFKRVFVYQCWWKQRHNFMVSWHLRQRLKQTNDRN